MDIHRCFLAFTLPEYNVEEFYQGLNAIKNVKMKLVDPGLFHLTLHFFGDLTSSEILYVEQILEELSFPSFNLQLGGTGVISARGKSPRVLFIDLMEGQIELKSIISLIRTKLSEHRFKINSRAPLPHLTIARIRGGIGRADLIHYWGSINPVFPEIRITNFDLIESKLTSSGPIYTKIRSFPLT